MQVTGKRIYFGSTTKWETLRDTERMSKRIKFFSNRENQVKSSMLCGDSHWQWQEFTCNTFISTNSSFTCDDICPPHAEIFGQNKTTELGNMKYQHTETISERHQWVQQQRTDNVEENAQNNARTNYLADWRLAPNSNATTNNKKSEKQLKKPFKTSTTPRRLCEWRNEWW